MVAKTRVAVVAAVVETAFPATARSFRLILMSSLRADDGSDSSDNGVGVGVGNNDSDSSGRGSSGAVVMKMGQQWSSSNEDGAAVMGRSIDGNGGAGDRSGTQ
ncbi:hypothetical protein Ancab_022584 [Ancistrocladus abbreviatus]